MNDKQTVLRARKPETRLQKTMRGALRWLLVALLAFGLGALIIAFAFFFPTRQKLDTATADRESANTTITEKTAQIATLQADNAILQENLVSATLHMAVLEALSDVRATSLAVAADDYAGAHLALAQATSTLDTLAGLVGVDQKDVLADLQQSAAQALIEMRTYLASAQPELDQLTTNLVQLENNLFPSPKDGQIFQNSPTHSKSLNILHKTDELPGVKSHLENHLFHYSKNGRVIQALPRYSKTSKILHKTGE